MFVTNLLGLTDFNEFYCVYLKLEGLRIEPKQLNISRNKIFLTFVGLACFNFLLSFLSRKSHSIGFYLQHFEFAIIHQSNINVYLPIKQPKNKDTN